MKLSGRQIQQVRDALLSGYPTRDELRAMVRIELDEELEAIAGGDNQRVVIFNLVMWAERTGSVDALVSGAHNHNRGNPELQQLVKAWQTQAPGLQGFGPIQSTPAAAVAGPASIDLFLSYSRLDSDAMRQVQEILRDAGLSVWTDEGLEAGTEHWQAAIQEALTEAQAVVVLLSPAAKASVWVNREVAYAQTLQKRVFPVLVSGDERSAVPLSLIDAQRVDGSKDVRQAVRRNLRSALLRHLGRPVVVPLIEFDWATIPAGTFLMGSTKQQIERAIANCQKETGNKCQEKWFTHEAPQHEVDIAEFRIARAPVTVAQFAAFVQATGYRTTAEEKGTASSWTGLRSITVQGADWAHPGGPNNNVEQKQNHPVTCVSWYDAQAFCKWVGVLLPTEAQWEKAARGTDGRNYPWGDSQPTKDTCNFNMNARDTTPVDTFSERSSPYGLLDMAGNVWEWTSSQLKPYGYDAHDGRESLQDVASRTLRGGAWSSCDNVLRCAYRVGEDPDSRSDFVGFRVVSPDL